MSKFKKLASIPTPKTAQKSLNLGRAMTVIDFNYQQKVMAEQFGDMGAAYGIEDVRFESHGNNVACIGMFWYQDEEDTIAKFPTVGDAQVIKGNVAEGYKKALTNAYSKAFLYLGIGLDTFIGKFMDDPYLDRAQQQTNPDTQMFSQAPTPNNGQASPTPNNGKTNGAQRPQVNPNSLEHVVEDITHRSLADLAKTPIVGKTSKGVPSYMAQKCPTLGALFKPGAKDPIGQLRDYFHKYHGATMEGPAFVLACIQFIKERYGAREALPFANVYSATFGHECPIQITLPTLSNVPLELDEVPYGN